MRITLRLLASLICLSTVVVIAFTSFEAQREQAQLEEELSRHATVLGDSLRESVELFLQTGQTAQLQSFVDRFRNRDHLVGAAIYSADGSMIAMTTSLPGHFQRLPEIVHDTLAVSEATARFEVDGERVWHLRASPLQVEGTVVGVLLLVHDASYIDAQRGRLWRQDFTHLLLFMMLLALVTLAIVQWSVIRPVKRMAEWMRRLRLGEDAGRLTPPKEELFVPLTREVDQMAESLLSAQSAAAEEARLRNAGESRWTPERLREHVHSVLQGRPLVVVSNREPYMHVRQNRQIQCVVPPGGLVTAMEPILRACRGTWIAHGSGDADRETVDAESRLRVPPEAPLYTLRRVWLDTEEEQGYYNGFANEGLWPLCHIAHTRPVFRAEDWTPYERVNAKFARVVLEEIAEAENPCLLIQDYHFALLPRLIKAKRPDARIALFWHIPWPNPEAWAICPWARELLEGMLGADLVGFQIQFHCNNFLDTVDRMLESRIDWEHFSITRADHTTSVKPFPISINGVDGAGASSAGLQATTGHRTLKALGLNVPLLGVGVDRLDYTKGIVERFLAIERFFERYPEFVGQFTFVELGAPSRTSIRRYQELNSQLDAEVERINRRFHTQQWKPIVFLKKQHSHQEIMPFYRAANVCMVTSLHDGMNLVSKEFVAARTDARGSLILSQFTGASRELRDALIVNPYDTEQVAEAIHYALTMDPEEQRTRMSRMRALIQEHNVYRWAASLVTELTRLHPTPPHTTSRVSLDV